LGRWLRYRLRLSEADQDILHTAYDATWTEELKEAGANANAVQKTWNQDSSAAGKFLNDDDTRHNILAMTVPWQEQVLSDTESEVCGLVAFYPDRDDWVVFREQIETAIYHGLHYRVQRIKNEGLRSLLCIEFKEIILLIRIYEVFSLKREIRGDFRKVCGLSLSCSSTERHCSPATRRDRLSGCGNRNVPVPPMKRKMTKERKKKDLGPLKVGIKHIAPTLFARLIQRDFSTTEARREPYRLASKLKTLHRVTKYSQNPTTRERDWIWPPPARFM
jgi:hypothetical protein